MGEWVGLEDNEVGDGVGDGGIMYAMVHVPGGTLKTPPHLACTPRHHDQDDGPIDDDPNDDPTEHYA